MTKLKGVRFGFGFWGGLMVTAPWHFKSFVLIVSRAFSEVAIWVHRLFRLLLEKAKI